MNCWMFPGQPLKFTPLPSGDANFQELASICRMRTGFDPFESEPESRGKGMSLHTGLQIHGTIMSLRKTRELLQSGAVPDIVAQHSMGIYPALAICGVISEGDALEMVALVGECMARIFKDEKYALGCAIGIEEPKLRSVISPHEVYFGNYNTSRHFLITGKKGDIEAAMEAAMGAGAFSVSIHNCDAPLHSPLMAEASGALKQIFSDYSYAAPHIPLMSHRGELLEHPEQIRAFLHDELLEPVFWEKSWHVLKKTGVDHFIEVGVGETLKKFNRWIESEQIAR